MYTVVNSNRRIDMPKKKTTKKTSKKKIEYADGKNEAQPKRSVEDILGIHEKNKFGVKSEAEFNEKLNNMGINEMQELAVTVGIFPSGTKPMLKNKLNKAFGEYMLASGRVVGPKTTQPNPETAKKFASIMNTWDN